MRREHSGRARLTDLRDNLFDRRWRKRFLMVRLTSAGFHHDLIRRDAARRKNLAPPIRKPAISDDQGVLAGGELARDSLHREGAAARDQRDALCGINGLQNARDVAHHILKGAGHVVQGSVRENDREL